MFHDNETFGSVHRPFNWSYADVAARASATGFTSADLYKLAIQLDDFSVWMLTATTPTWLRIDQGGASPGFYASAASEGVSSTTSTTYVQKVQLVATGAPSGGDYKLSFHALLACAGAATDAYARVIAGTGATVLEEQFEDTGGATQTFGFNGFIIGPLVDNATYTLQYRTEGGGTAYIRNARLLLERLSTS